MDRREPTQYAAKLLQAAGNKSTEALNIAHAAQERFVRAAIAVGLSNLRLAATERDSKKRRRELEEAAAALRSANRIIRKAKNENPRLKILDGDVQKLKQEIDALQ